jgi:hypothetical protein
LISAALRLALVSAFAVVLNGCGGGSRATVPAQVEDRVAAPGAPAAESMPRSGPAPAQAPRVTAYRPPRQPEIARPPANLAVQQLQRRAEEQRRRGDHDAAVASLERALRIAPDDALLWHRLAGLRSDQGLHAMVTELAAKSNTLAAPGDSALRRDNWRLIAQARRGLGDNAGADEAERMAQRLGR